MTEPSRDISFERADGDTLVARLSGAWKLDDGVPAADPVRGACEANAPVRRLVVNVDEVNQWDSALIAFLRTVHVDLGAR
jgi:hypothetical protein